MPPKCGHYQQGLANRLPSDGEPHKRCCGKLARGGAGVRRRSLLYMSPVLTSRRPRLERKSGNVQAGIERPAPPVAAVVTPPDATARRAAAPPRVVLASASSARADILRRAGVGCEFDPAAIDEDEIKRAMGAEGAPAAAVAETLAELKAQRVSRHHPDALVIGADQILDCAGVWFDKPVDNSHARTHLMALRDRTHELISCVCVVRDGQRLWHHLGHAKLTMRPFTDGFLDDYLAAVGPAALESVGAYQLEGRGAQLFSKVEGDYFTILGLPLLALLDFLRNHGVVKP